MGGEWPELQLSELCSYINRGSAPAYTEDDGILVLNQKCIRDQRVNFSLGRRTDPRKKKIANERMLQPFDILVNSTGIGTLGRVAQVLDLPEPATVDSHVTILRPNNEKVDPHYLGYVVRCFERKIEMLGEGSTGQTELAKTKLAAFSVPISPDRDEQRAIAHILGTLDDKIELNQRMNETLEAMARALFKSWFVDFDPVVVNAIKAGNPIPEKFAKRAAHYRQNPDALRLPEHILRLFPDRFVDSELGPIPEGWGLSTISAEYDLTMGQSPPGTTYNENGNGMPFFQGRRNFGFRYPSPRVYCTAPTRIANAGDTLVSVRAPVGDVNMAYETCCVGRGVAAVRHKSGSRSYTYYAMLSLGERFKRFEAEGTVFGSINKKQFQNLPSLKVPPDIVTTFETFAYPIDENIRSSEEEVRLLAKLRDSLLPKLISGELRVPDAEKLLEDAP